MSDRDDATQAADALERLTGPLPDQVYEALAHAVEHSTGGEGGCNLDYYTVCAIDHFGGEYTDVTPEQRQIAKKLAYKWMYESGHLTSQRAKNEITNDPGFKMRMRIHNGEIARRHEARAEAEHEAEQAADGGPDLRTPLGMALYATRQRERLIVDCNYGQLEARVLASVLGER